MGLGEERASSYRARAAEMRQMAEFAQSEDLRASFLRLEASWLRLAEAVEKAEEDQAAMPLRDDEIDPASPRPN
jgi:hypothetical protein